VNLTGIRILYDVCVCITMSEWWFFC
jgi:hypothetical protein